MKRAGINTDLGILKGLNTSPNPEIPEKISVGGEDYSVLQEGDEVYLVSRGGQEVYLGGDCETARETLRSLRTRNPLSRQIPRPPMRGGQEDYLTEGY